MFITLHFLRRPYCSLFQNSHFVVSLPFADVSEVSSLADDIVQVCLAKREKKFYLFMVHFIDVFPKLNHSLFSDETPPILRWH